MASPPAPAGVRAQMESMRQKLLDLSLRNRMLNYRPSKRLGLEIVGEDSVELHRILVEGGRKMSFVGRPDPPQKRLDVLHAHEDEIALAHYREAAEEELDAFLENAAMPVDQLDTKLNTAEPESLLQLKLRAIQREAALANEELGVNTLFLTLGMLEWRETPERSLHAPLLFVPVRLERQSNGSMRLLHDGSDLGGNLPLSAKLMELNVRLPAFSDEKGVLTFFEEVESSIRARNDWNVDRNRICLGFFNYEKYAMYMDLGGELWPEDRKPWQHEDVVAMLGEGYTDPDVPVREGEFIDDARPLPGCFEVYDADSSQTLALIRASQGLSMVVEGPPGTGKSQTITNVISEAVAAGKRVLFVSAKRAALEVVKRRLHEAGLGDMCLDLHDKLTNRRTFYEEIQRTANLSVRVKPEQERLARLEELRDLLNAHSSAVNEPIQPYAIAPFVAMTELARLGKETDSERTHRIPFDFMAAWPASQARTLEYKVRALQERLAGLGVPVEHPFWGAELEYLDPSAKLDLEAALAQAKASLEAALAAFEDANTALGIELAPSFEHVKVLQRCAETAAAAPPHEGVAVSLDDWSRREPEVRHVLELLRRRSELRSEVERVLQPGVWTADETLPLQAYERHADRVLRFLSGEFRRAQAWVRSQLQPMAHVSPLEARDHLRKVAQVKQIEREIETSQPVLSRLYGAQWRGLQSDPDDLERLLQWVLDLHRAARAGLIPAGLLRFFEAGSFDPEAMARVQQARLRCDVAAKELADATHLLRDRRPVADEPLATLLARVERWIQHAPSLPQFIGYWVARNNAVEAGLGPVAEIADRWPDAGTMLTRAYLRAFYTGVMRAAMAERPELRTFERAAHEQAIAEFQSLDDFKLKYNRARVRQAHLESLPHFGNAAGNLLQLRMQCQLSRGHKPIRWIMSRAGEAIQRIKPVFMMSPLSVAIHLPPDLPPFDMVIFDEASQVKPEDALCAIVRARQTIVVGDTRQMPPTSFFDRVADDEDWDEEAEDEADEIAKEARKLESVLNMMSMAVVGAARRPGLRWHYRSVHPSLIQPSNEMFYENRLVVFPSPSVTHNGRRIGVLMHHHPETTYEPGARRRYNKGEALLVAKAVLRHVQTCPDESLMVAAMNKPQADLIYDEIQKLERVHPDAFATFRARHPNEPLDVKNLENVQGDERDVVFISVTYGRDEHGVLRQQFGPLLRDGGERRLNVLITRARKRCEVFSNLTADDLRVEPGRRGLADLKRYLQFAQSERLDVALATGREAESPFEEEVAAALVSHGYQVDAQVGSEGYRIDLAIRDPHQPGRYLLGIECDGATYHSALSARDRDKLRQRVLEARGWRIHRIWSWDWWQDPQQEIRRVLEALAKVGEEPDAPEACEPESPDHEVHVEVGQRTSVDATRPYPAPATPPLIEDLRALADYVVEVVRQEEPIHHELLIVRLRDAAGFGRAGKQFRTSVESLIENARRTKRIAKVVDAYCIGDPATLRPRDWSERPASEKKVGYVPEVELIAALKTVVRDAFGITHEEAMRRALNLLGFKRLTSDASTRAAPLLQRLVASGELEVKGDQLFWAPRSEG